MNRFNYFILFLLLVISSELSASENLTSIIHHQVFIWLQDDVESNLIDNIIVETKKLKEIPGIIDLHVGKVVSSDRNIVDDSYDVGIHMTFNSVNSMNAYLKHPEHQEYLRNHIKPVLEKIRVYDFSETAQ